MTLTALIEAGAAAGAIAPAGTPGRTAVNSPLVATDFRAGWQSLLQLLGSPEADSAPTGAASCNTHATQSGSAATTSKSRRDLPVLEVAPLPQTADIDPAAKQTLATPVAILPSDTAARDSHPHSQGSAKTTQSAHRHPTGPISVNSIALPIAQPPNNPTASPRVPTLTTPRSDSPTTSPLDIEGPAKTHTLDSNNLSAAETQYTSIDPSEAVAPRQTVSDPAAHHHSAIDPAIDPSQAAPHAPHRTLAASTPSADSQSTRVPSDTTAPAAPASGQRPANQAPRLDPATAQPGSPAKPAPAERSIPSPSETPAAQTVPAPSSISPGAEPQRAAIPAAKEPAPKSPQNASPSGKSTQPLDRSIAPATSPGNAGPSPVPPNPLTTTSAVLSPSAIAHPSPAAQSSTSQAQPSVPLTSADTFRVLDTADATPHTTWIHASPRQAEAGYLDPTLGWIGVRAETTGSALHASILAGSADAAASISAHLAGLSTFVAEHHGASASVTLAASDNPQAGNAFAQAGHGSSADRQSQPNAAAPDTHPGPASEDQSPHLTRTEQAAPALRPGSHISVLA